MHRLPFFLFLVVVLLQWPLWSSHWYIYQNKKEIIKQEKINQELIYHNAALQADIQDIKDGNDAVQERARLQLGMIKSDEVFVQIMDQPSAAAPLALHTTPYHELTIEPVTSSNKLNQP